LSNNEINTAGTPFSLFLANTEIYTAETNFSRFLSIVDIALKIVIKPNYSTGHGACAFMSIFRDKPSETANFCDTVGKDFVYHACGHEFKSV